VGQPQAEEVGVTDRASTEYGTQPYDILQVKDLHVYYYTTEGAVKAVDGMSFDLKTEERIGLAGESGSGKSTMAKALMRLIKRPGRIVGGEVWLDGRDVLALPEEEMQRLRLAEISMIAQGAQNSLNPVARVKNQILDGIKDHGVRMTKQQQEQRVRTLLQRVGLEPEVAEMYPHELSGGMKQRVIIAIAICLEPKVIIADEPTSALDVVVQRRVMETFLRVQEDLGASVILVGHDMGLMAQFVDRLGIMYAGKLVELSPVKTMFTQPYHPYAQLLISSLPSLEQKGEFRGIPGLTPSLLDLPPGCAFRPRCPFAMPRCAEEEPILQQVPPHSRVACHLIEDGA
jgi:oligopeptide/dipeptide ABC transporter ATP-binding protein